MANLFWKVKTYLESKGKTQDEITNGNVVLENVEGNDVIKTWNVSEVTQPTDSQLNALDTNATKDYNNEIIRDTRRVLYGDIGEQLDEIYKDIDSWKARIKKIKDDNPKE
jgi:hypothetical protein